MVGLAWFCAGVELIYLLAANTLLSGGWLQGWIEGEDLRMDYASAYTVWPGTVHLRQFELTLADTNVQLQLNIERATVAVSLHELLRKRFHALWAETHGTRFRLRHNVETSLGRGARLAAYPVVRGYDGLPLYDARDAREPSPPSDDDWTIHMESVVARVSELWVLEYHYQGDAVATGAFELHPGQELRLWPSQLEIHDGTLSIQQTPVALELTASLQAEIARTDLTATQGAAIFDSLSVSLDAELGDGDLAALQAYLEPNDDIVLSGTCDASLALGVTRGAVAPGSYARVAAPRAAVSTPLGVLRGDLEVALHSTSDAIVVSLVTDEFSGVETGAPRMVELDAMLALEPLQLSQRLGVVDHSLSVRRLDVPRLSWLSSFPARLRLSGAAHAAGQWRSRRGGDSTGWIRAGFSGVSVASDALAAQFDGELHSDMTRDPRSLLVWTDVQLVLDGVLLSHADESAALGRVTASSAAMRLLEDQGALQGTIDWRIEDIDPVLELFAPDLPAQLVGALAGLGQATARTAIFMADEHQRIEVLGAESGALELHGTWQSRGAPAQARFFVDTGPVALGISIDDSGIDVDPGVSEQFAR